MRIPPLEPELILARARELYAENSWADAYDTLQSAVKVAPLTTPDLWRLAWCCGLGGRDAEMLRVLEDIYELRAEARDPLPGARAAFWLGFRLLGLGESSRGSGWLARAARLATRAQQIGERFGRLPRSIRRTLRAAGAERDASRIAPPP